MKKRWLFLFFALTFVLSGCSSSAKKDLERASRVLEEINLPDEITSDIDLPATVMLDNKAYSVIWHSNNPQALTNQGVVVQTNLDQEVVLTARVQVNDQVKQRTFTIIILKSEELVVEAIVQALNTAIASIVVPEEYEVMDEVDWWMPLDTFSSLQPYLDVVEIHWSSSKPEILDSIGKTHMEEDQEVLLTVQLSIGEHVVEQHFPVVVVGLVEMANRMFEAVAVPSAPIENINLPSTIAYQSNSYVVNWQSSNPQALTSDGVVYFGVVEEEVDLIGVIEIEDWLIVKRFIVFVACDPALQTSAFQSMIVTALSFVDVPEEVNAEDSIDLPLSLNAFGIQEKYLSYLTVEWSSTHPEIWTPGNDIVNPSSKTVVTLVLRLTMNEATATKTFIVEVVPTVDLQARVEELALLFSLGFDTAYESFTFPTSYEEATIEWFSSNNFILNQRGEVRSVDTPIALTLYALFTIDQIYEYEIEIPFQVIPLPSSVRIEKMMESVSLPEIVDRNLDLPTSFDLGVSATWSSTNEHIIAPNGRVHLDKVIHQVTLIITMHHGGETMSKSFEVQTAIVEESFFQYHNFIDRASGYLYSNMNSVLLQDDKLVLDSGKLEGSYTSEIVETNPFKSLVVSWASTSSTNATVEVLIRVRVDGVWSKYLSYRPWGLGRQNASLNDSDAIARLSVDEVIIQNQKTATAFQYQVYLRRGNAAFASPRLSLVAVALDIANYTYPVDTSLFPTFKDYVVPMWSQRNADVDGSSICSPTSATMLLNYKGHDFSSHNVKQHSYIAALFRDYKSSPIYGNWVFNTVGMSAFGEDAYVARMYSFAELQKHLLEVGPVAASIAGNVGLYNTSGHLLVVRGFRVEGNQTFVIVNDPWIDSNYVNYAGHSNLFVYYEFPLSVFMSVWRGIVYVIE